MRRIHLIFALLFTCMATLAAQTAAEWKTLKSDINLFLANDLGRNGYYDQRKIADLMGIMAETIGPEAVIAIGDVHHFDGVASVSDPLWSSNYEQIYTHPELMIPWMAVLGNHEYRGNTQAVLDYSQVSRRWRMPDRYYTHVFSDEDDGVSLRLVFVDTTPLIESYHTDSRYPDVAFQDVERQLAWMDSVLTQASEDWVVVVGHHPVYAETGKDVAEQEALQRKLMPIMQRSGKVKAYVCGHIHNFQHIRAADDDIVYVVNSAGALSRKVKPITDRPYLSTLFASDATGFSVLSASHDRLVLSMIDAEGRVIHSIDL